MKLLLLSFLFIQYELIEAYVNSHDMCINNRKQFLRKQQLSMVMIPGFSEIDANTMNSINIATNNNVIPTSTEIIQDLSIILGAIAVYTFDNKPVGSSRNDLLDVRKSTIPVKETVKDSTLGVFASSVIPKGTILGTFPGFIKTVDDALNSKVDDNARKLAKQYMWAISESMVLDPTNTNGILGQYVSF